MPGRKKKGQLPDLLILVSVLILLTITGITILTYYKKKDIRRSMFSWKKNAISEEIFTFMKRERISVLYQYFSGETEENKIIDFLDKAQKEQIEVYSLTGDPKWALEESESEMIREIEWVAGINSLLKEGAFKGIVFDIEPYLLDEWDEEPRTNIMNEFVLQMRSAYKTAEEHNLRVILCIPYFYDDKGFAIQLEELTASCCDGIAVMNYYRDKEAEHIKTEAEYAQKYGKELINIYELQAPGEHDLTERNTYYNDGTGAAEENFRKLKKAYAGQSITMALHDYESVKEILNRE